MAETKYTQLWKKTDSEHPVGENYVTLNDQGYILDEKSVDSLPKRNYKGKLFDIVRDLAMDEICLESATRKTAGWEDVWLEEVIVTISTEMK